MKESPKKKNKFMAFLSSLCSSRPSSDRDNSKDKKKPKFKVNKVPRLTFQLDRVLVKMSRKNVAEQQFMENEVLTFHLEKYLIGRLKECDIVVFSGQFSNFLTEKIPYSIQLKSTKQEAFQGQNNYLLSNHNGQIKYRSNVIDALVFQLYFGQNQNSCKKSEHSGKTQQTNQNSQLGIEVDKIEQILRYYQKKVKSFIFICHKNLRLEDIHNLFLVFKEKYLFQFEKVKKIQKTVCNIVYISTETKFLRIDDLSLGDFVTTQFDKMNAFIQQKNKNLSSSAEKSIQLKKKKSKQSAKQSKQIISNNKNQQIVFSLKELSKRKAFETLLLKMFEKNLQLPITQALATILQMPQKKINKINWFLDLMNQRYIESRDLILKYRADPQQQKEEDFNKTSSEFTPIFANKSNNFSKMTALFKTHSSGEDEDFVLCHEQDRQDLQF